MKSKTRQIIKSITSMQGILPWAPAFSLVFLNSFQLDATPLPAVYTANFSDGSVSIIDPALQSVVATIPGYAAPIGLAVAGTAMYVSDYNRALLKPKF